MSGPNTPAAPVAIDARALLGAMQAVQFAASTVERKASTLIWESSGSQTELDAAVTFLMSSMKTFSDAVDQYMSAAQTQGGTGGNPPKCGPGFHLEFGICVPDN